MAEAIAIKGTIFTNTEDYEKTQGKLNDEIRSIAGVLTANMRALGDGKYAAVIKVDPYPYGGKFTQEVHDTIISEIEDINGIRKFKVHESPFVKPLPKQVYNPVPNSPTSYDSKPQISPKQR
jgi:hypothetical protein